MYYLPMVVGVTAAAVVVQAGILLALFVAVRKSSSRMEALATEVKTKVMPIADTAQTMLAELRPKIENHCNQRQRNDPRGPRPDRTAGCDHQPGCRQDAAAGHSRQRIAQLHLDRIEETGDVVHRTVVSPARQLYGLVQG